MPATLSYPGVYVEEVSSGAGVVPSVSTATAAFVGYTCRGPVDEPVRVTSFAEWERLFGGLADNTATGYAVHQFFANGGTSAVVVRVIREGSATPASVTLHAHERHGHERHGHERHHDAFPGTVPEELPEHGVHEGRGRHEGQEPHLALQVQAREPGRWGNELRVLVDYGTREPHERFNLHVVRVTHRACRVESFHGLSMDPHHHRFAPAVINAESGLVKVVAVGEHRPEPSGTISAPLDRDLLDLDVDIVVRIGDVEREFHLYRPECDGPPPRTLFELAMLLESRLRALPDRPGRHAFSHAEVRVLGHRLQTIAGSLHEDDVVHFSGPGAEALGLEAVAHPPVFVLHGGDNGEPPRSQDLVGSEPARTGIQALRDVEDVNLVNLPDLAGYGSVEDVLAALSAATELCRERRCFLLIDAPASWTTVNAARCGIQDFEEIRSDHAALYFPHLRVTDPVTGRLRTVPPGGAIAGVIARTDAERGVWKAPAGTSARLAGARAPAVALTDREDGLLNPLAVNVVRSFPGTGPVVWGARTLEGTDEAVGERAGDWAYVPVRRLALHVEESLHRGLRWVVFEPNTEQLWQQIRLDVAAYLDTLFRRGAFAGGAPREAYFVRCDATTTTPADVANGVVNVVVGIAPVTPAEFVVVRIQHLAGRTQTP